MDDGYAQSFSADEPEKYLPMLEKYGIVVIQALPADLCDETVRAMQDEANRLAQTMSINREVPPKTSLDFTDSSTWNTENWPAANKFLFDTPTACPAAWRVRLHPSIRRIFAEIYQTDRLVSSVDKWLFARGTRNIRVTTSDGQVEMRAHVPEWEQSLPLHVHLDPWRFRQEQQKARTTSTATNCTGQVDEEKDGEYLKSIMAVVALVDCPKEMGGHSTVPGSAPFMDTWAVENLDKKPGKVIQNYYVQGKKRDEQEKLLKKYKQGIPMRKGEIVVWDIRQFHGTFCNTSSQPRIGQFVRYIPCQDWFQTNMDRFSPQSVYKNWPDLRDETEESLNELGCTSKEELCIAGLARWEEQSA